MPIKNLDNETNLDLRGQITEALRSEDNDAVVESLVRMAEGIQSQVLNEARSVLNQEAADREILSRRGQAQLTAEERNYYNAVIEHRGFTGLEVTLPKTVFERVFDDLDQNHELLSEIQFENTTGATEWIIRTSDVSAAWWGKLIDPIKKELEQGFDKVKTDMFKLTAYMPIAKSMLDLGAEWIDRYVRAVLTESMSLALELAIIAGTGKDQPIGMIKNLKGSVVEGVYPDKTPVELLDLTPKTLGKSVMAPLTKEGKRAVPKVLILVNPLDYWAKVFALTTFMTQNGAYVSGVLPIPAKIIQSVAVPTGKMVAGMGKDYFLGIASQAKIEYSDEAKFIEDERVYVSKQYANGQPKDNDSFLLFDISKLGENSAPAMINAFSASSPIDEVPADEVPADEVKAKGKK